MILFFVGSLTNSLNIPECEESMKDCEQASLNMDNNNNIKFSVWVSFFEIYNECIYDLFVPASSKFQKRKMLRLSQDVKGYSFIKGIVMNAFYFIARSFFLDFVIANWRWKIFILIFNITVIREICTLQACFGI